MINKTIDPKTGHCLATFTCHPPASAKHVSICGDFNHWKPGVDTMSREADGTFTTTLALKPGARFSFKYLADVGGWLNDDKADDYEQNEYGVWNCIVATPSAPKQPSAKKAPATKQAPAKKAPAKKKVAAKKAKSKTES